MDLYLKLRNKVIGKFIFIYKHFVNIFYIKYIIINYNYYYRSVVTECHFKNVWLWVRFLLEEIKYLLTFIFSFIRSGVAAKRGVEFRHSTRDASRTQWKVGNSGS